MKTTRTRTLAHLAATLLLGFGIVAGLFAGAATPASAASAVSGCFVWDTGTAYANQPVHLQQQSRGRWTTIRSGKTNSRGCATFTRTPTNANLRLLGSVAFGDSNIGMAVYQGTSGYYARPGNGTVATGTGTVRLVQCVPGLYGYCAGLA
ncbi:MAG: hypothetical protein K1X38_02870 [Microthrixaceae bacterium]|nr:hypothetical protein [Microthrixaceae bacterium]